MPPFTSICKQRAPRYAARHTYHRRHGPSHPALSLAVSPSGLHVHGEEQSPDEHYTGRQLVG
eukprot:76328-Chlamydomonas_euryale.AAC.1